MLIPYLLNCDPSPENSIFLSKLKSISGKASFNSSCAYLGNFLKVLDTLFPSLFAISERTLLFSTILSNLP